MAAKLHSSLTPLKQVRPHISDSYSIMHPSLSELNFVLVVI